jgi:hypothetical protein
MMSNPHNPQSNMRSQTIIRSQHVATTRQPWGPHRDAHTSPRAETHPPSHFILQRTSRRREGTASGGSYDCTSAVACRPSPAKTASDTHSTDSHKARWSDTSSHPSPLLHSTLSHQYENRTWVLNCQPTCLFEPVAPPLRRPFMRFVNPSLPHMGHISHGRPVPFPRPTLVPKPACDSHKIAPPESESEAQKGDTTATDKTKGTEGLSVLRARNGSDGIRTLTDRAVLTWRSK